MFNDVDNPPKMHERLETLAPFHIRTGVKARALICALETSLRTTSLRVPTNLYTTHTSCCPLPRKALRIKLLRNAVLLNLA
jgi:hypothetical protein